MAFHFCKSLFDVAIPRGCKSIGFYAFTATSLTDVTIPQGCTSIEHYAFHSCASLAEVTIPASCVVGCEVFANCPNVRVTKR
jgi:hypothetical protein